MHTGKEAHSAKDYFNGLKHSFWTGLELAEIQFSIDNWLWAIVSHIKLKLKRIPTFWFLKIQLFSHSFGLQMDRKTKTIQERHYHVSHAVGWWEYHNARVAQRAPVDTRVKRGKGRESRLFRVFRLVKKKKHVRLIFDKIDAYFNVV